MHNLKEYNPPSDKRNYRITIFVDSKESWFFPWAEKLKDILYPYHNVLLCSDKRLIQAGNFNFILGCTRLLEKRYLQKITGVENLLKKKTFASSGCKANRENVYSERVWTEGV